MYHFLKINVIYLRQRIFNYCNILKRVMKNTGLFVFLFSLCLCTTSCVDDEADFTGGGNIDVEMPVDPDPDATIDEKVFDVINLDYPGLENVKTAFEAGDKYTALVKLLDYYRTRVDVINRNVNLFNPTITDADQKTADYALDYKFKVKDFVDKDGIPYSFKGKDGQLINWELEVKDLTDQEFRYQRHRHQWMLPQAKAYAVSKDERYVESWKTVYQDWLKTYPYEDGTKFPPEGGSENDVDYQWKGLQVAERVISQIDIMAYFIQSRNFTPEWLSTFLVAFAKHVECMRLNYYQSGNILLTQAQAVTTAGILMPEFKNAETWAIEGSAKMTEQVGTQFNDDGVQIELDPSYHISAISDAYEAYLTAEDNNKENLFPATYLAQLETPAKFTMDITYPNFSIEDFNDTRSSTWSKSVLQKNFRKYVTMFPNNTDFQYMANGKGTAPGYLMASYPTSGYYVLRSGWKETDAMMILKNNNDPRQSWHCQSDNGTFGLYYNGHNFFPDAGVYAYSGNNRVTYAGTERHNTITINSKSLLDSYRKGECLLWKEDNGVQIVVTQNAGMYTQKDAPDCPLTHRRSIFHDTNNKLFVIVDEAIGNEDFQSNTNLNFHLCPGAVLAGYNTDGRYATGYTNFADGGNIVLRTFLDKEENVSIAADKVYLTKDTYTSPNIGVPGKDEDKAPYTRKGYALTCKPKQAGGLIRFISVIRMGEGTVSENIQAEFVTNIPDNNRTLPTTTTVKVTLDGNDLPEYTYDLNQNSSN